MQNLIAVDPKSVKNEVCKRQCQPPDGCYLHLHGASSWVRGTTERPSVYSAESAPGLVMASGEMSFVLFVYAVASSVQDALCCCPNEYISAVRFSAVIPMSFIIAVSPRTLEDLALHQWSPGTFE